MKKILILILINCLIFNLLAQNKPELFVLSVGVSKYQNPKYNLSFAHKDAIDLAAEMQKQTGLFDVRKVSVLTDQNATRSKIRQELMAMKKLITPNDLFMFIFSGHGLNEALVTHDFNMDDRGATTLNKSDLAELVGEFNCNYIMLIDACHSGSFAKGIDISTGKDIAFDFVKEQNLANEKLLRALNASDKANIVIGSSSSSEKSDECTSCQNGYFTQSILDAFDGKTVVDPTTKKEYMPDKDKNGFIYTNELDDYLKEVVSIKTRANSINQSVISKQSPGFNFPIAKLQDTDNDGFADMYDKCLDQKGPANGCPDADGDSVADKEDNCPDAAGSKDNKGCPIEAAKIIYKNNANYALFQKGMTKTLIFPGSGEKLVTGKSDKMWVGQMGYGAIAFGLGATVLSGAAYNKYKSAQLQTEIDKNRKNSKLFSYTSIAMAGIGITAWAIGIKSYNKLRKSKLAINENGIGIQITLR